jgi:hypothetical protein
LRGCLQNLKQFARQRGDTNYQKGFGLEGLIRMQSIVPCLHQANSQRMAIGLPFVEER